MLNKTHKTIGMMIAAATAVSLISAPVAQAQSSFGMSSLSSNGGGITIPPISDIIPDVPGITPNPSNPNNGSGNNNGGNTPATPNNGNVSPEYVVYQNVPFESTWGVPVSRLSTAKQYTDANGVVIEYIDKNGNNVKLFHNANGDRMIQYYDNGLRPTVNLDRNGGTGKTTPDAPITPAPVPTPTPNPKETKPAETAQDVVNDLANQINQYRASYGLSALRVNQFAQDRSQYHASAIGSVGYRNFKASHNNNIHDSAWNQNQKFSEVAASAPSGTKIGGAAELMYNWKNSPSHNAIILTRGAQIMGIGVSRDVVTGNWVGIVKIR